MAAKGTRERACTHKTRSSFVRRFVRTQLCSTYTGVRKKKKGKKKEETAAAAAAALHAQMKSVWR